MALTNSVNGWKIKKVTTSGKVLAAGEVFCGVLMPTAGTLTTLTAYDDATAVAGNLLIPTTATLTAGQFVDCTGGLSAVTIARSLADGIILGTGLYLTIAGTGSPVFWVLYK